MVHFACCWDIVVVVAVIVPMVHFACCWHIVVVVVVVAMMHFVVVLVNWT